MLSFFSIFVLNYCTARYWMCWIAMSNFTTHHRTFFLRCVFCFYHCIHSNLFVQASIFFLLSVVASHLLVDSVIHWFVRDLFSISFTKFVWNFFMLFASYVIAFELHLHSIPRENLTPNTITDSDAVTSTIGNEWIGFGIQCIQNKATNCQRNS